MLPLSPLRGACSLSSPLLTFRNATHEPGRHISLNRCTFIQKRRARLTSAAPGQPSPPSPPGPSPTPAAAAAAEASLGGGGGGDGDGELRLLCFPSETTLAAGATVEVHGGGGGGRGNLRNNPDVFGSRAGGGSGIHPPPMLPPPITGLSELPWRRREEDWNNSASSASHDLTPSADERMTFSRRHLAYS